MSSPRSLNKNETLRQGRNEIFRVISFLRNSDFLSQLEAEAGVWNLGTSRELASPFSSWFCLEWYECFTFPALGKRVLDQHRRKMETFVELLQKMPSSSPHPSYLPRERSRVHCLLSCRAPAGRWTKPRQGEVLHHWTCFILLLSPPSTLQGERKNGPLLRVLASVLDEWCSNPCSSCVTLGQSLSIFHPHL